jgi:allantoinase
MRSDPDRYDYLPLIDRPKIGWPNGARVAFWVSPNVEYYELDPPPNPGHAIWWRPQPDILNYSYRDYGNRVGLWRMIEIMGRYGVRGSVSLSAALCDHIPEAVDACAAAGWEFFSHGIYNTRWIPGLDDEQLREFIADSVATIKRQTGQSVQGWLAPAVHATDSVFDLLPEFGIRYTLDLLHDDQPLPVKVREGRLISIPYSTELNDTRLLALNGIPPARFVAMAKAWFDQLYEEGAENGMVMCLPIHPYIIAQPHRIAAFAEVLRYITEHDGVWVTTAREICDWYYAQHYDAVAGFLARRGGSAR